MTCAIGYIVEGYSEVAAVPILARRIAASLDPPIYSLVIPEPIRVNPNRLIGPTTEDLRPRIELAFLKARQELDKLGEEGHAVVHLLFDREQDHADDCPAALGPRILTLARSFRPDLSIAVSLAKQEFESWFLATAETLGGRRGLPPDIASHPDPESVRDAKGWLADRMNRRYVEREDQPAFAAVFDLELARSRSPSFDKFFRDTVCLLTGERLPRRSS